MSEGRLERDRRAEEWLRGRHTEQWYVGNATVAEWDAAYRAVDVVERISEVELVGTFDARVWAEQFVDRFAGSRIGPGDVSEDTMLGWFANAIMAGYDEHARRVSDGREQG